MKILVACEYSQIVTCAFREKGHEAYSCDISPTEGNPAWHIQGDAFEAAVNDCWDMMVAHPPCTFLANSGVRWLKGNPERRQAMKEAAQFFRLLLDLPIPKIAIENPIPHKYAVDEIGRNYGQIVRPWQFGCNESKSICLWLRGLPPLQPEVTVKPENVQQSHWRMPPGPGRQKERSRFFPDVARAMAEQWG